MAANLEFTDDENNVMQDAAFFIHKKTITDKIVSLFGGLNDETEMLLLQYADLLPPEVMASKGKISKGESYEQLPYLLLDSPRFFTKDNVFAFRTMFWWGNHFSCTIHLSGIYWESFKPHAVEFITYAQFNRCYIGTGDGEWHHHLRTDNYTAAADVLINKKMLSAIIDKPFFKAAIRLPLDHTSELQAEAIRFYKWFLDCYMRERKEPGE